MQHRLCYAVGSSDQITDYVNIVFILYHVEGSMAKEKRVSSCFIIYNSVVPPSITQSYLQTVEGFDWLVSCRGLMVRVGTLESVINFRKQITNFFWSGSQQRFYYFIEKHPGSEVEKNPRKLLFISIFTFSCIRYISSRSPKSRKSCWPPKRTARVARHSCVLWRMRDGCRCTENWKWPQ